MPDRLSRALLISGQDVEAQRDSATKYNDPDASRPEYAHVGRGGAGNFKPTATTAGGGGIMGDLSTFVKQDTIAESGYSGRGGAGNIRGDSERRKPEAQARAAEAQEKAYKETVKDVERGLKQPEKAHLGGDRVGEL